MIVIETEEDGADARALPHDIPAASLLIACAEEAERQAQLLADLDRTLGTALLGLGKSPDRDSFARLRAAVIGDLQLADRLRQESDGLARTLRLLASVGTLSDRIEGADLHALIPNAALLHRLLAHR